jgi:hypothetical protein
MALRKTGTDHSGRQLDLELLDHVGDTTAFHPVVADVHGSPRIVSGIEKAVQRYAKLFLTELGSCRADRGVGSHLLSEIGMGMVQSEADLDHLCSVADLSALTTMMREDADEAFGQIPDDERVVATNLDEISLDRAGGRAHAKVTLTTAAGDDYVFLVPVAAGVH